ncbi:MAG TPA: TlpA disulfide reductase family protein [Cytophagales bacterium]|nr:TlpA disulfide reductase family protein [Cytophagales bacterium]
MKKTFLYSLFLSLCVPFLLFAKPVTVKGIVTNSSPYKYAYLLEFYGGELIKKDSALIKNNEFAFKSPDAFPRGFYQIKFKENVFINLILSNENVLITADLNDLNSSLKVSNSKENEAYLKYKDLAEKQNGYIVAIQNKANKVYGLQKTDPAAFQVQMTALKSEFDSLNKVQQDFNKKLADENEGLFIAKFLKNSAVEASHTKQTFISSADLNDPELLRGDMLNTKIQILFNSFVEQNLEAWQAEAQNLIDKAKGTKGQEIVFISLLDIFGSVDMDFAGNLARQYAKTFPKSEKAKNILASMPKPSPQVGETAPNIILPDPDGKSISLESLRGKVVLIDFWASWCGPCRQENPNVVRVFNKYKDKGFTIYGVSLDKDRDRWLQAIEKDQLTWHHVSDLKFWNSKGAELYGVRSIPATYLIGKDGKIIAKNLRGEKLEFEIKRVLETNN